MPFREFILSNFWLKGLSLVLATLIWFALSQSSMQNDVKALNPLFTRNKEVDFTRAVTVLKSPAEQRVFRVDPAQVTVRLRGDAGILDQLNPEDVQAFVNVGLLHDPQGTLRVDAYVPTREIEVRAISPAHVDVRPLSANP